MAADGSSKRIDVFSSLPPRKINVQKFSDARAAELESLHSIVSDRLNKDFRTKRNKRRRTTSYNNLAAKKRYRKRQRSESFVGRANGSETGNEEKKIPRRVRRRIELKGNPGIGFCASGDGTKRLRTHVWHAKRFSMTKLWDFHLPLGLHGRGRGSRAVLKWFRQGVLVHDASYHAAVQLEGPEGSLLSILDMLTGPSPSSLSKEVSHSVLTGHIYGSAMLYHVEAPLSRPIAPVIYMWRPSHISNRVDDGEGRDGLGTDGPPENRDGSEFRKLWVWIHASSFSEGYDSIKLACQNLMNERGVSDSVNCFSLEGRLAKLEVLGPKASQLLQKTLHPVKSLENPSFLKKCVATKADDCSEINKPNVLYDAEDISSCAILGLTVMDPRTIPSNGHDDARDSLDTTTKAEADKLQEFFESLWDARSELSPPEEENVLCWEKHRRLMDFLCLDDPISEIPTTSNKPKSSRSCPILLLKHKNLKNAPTGWSLILPLNWVKVFWNVFVSKGARAIGQREKRWVTCEAGLPFFPSDFPDCNAYSSLTTSEAAALEQKAELRPPALRPFRIPIPPPWNSILVTFDKFLPGGPEIDLSTQKSTAAAEESLNVNGKKEHQFSGSHGNLFVGIVARTSRALTTFLESIAGDNLLLFPQASNGDTNVMTFLKDKTMLTHGEKANAQIDHGNKLCLLRVFLQAYKQGVFEDGAVICAPRLTDISLLKTRSESNEGGPTIPQSCVRSYYQEKPSGAWELHIPEDSASKESHRWPIGFVTTGFVRGSKKPTAEAFCDAVLLARLREEQWRDTPAKRRKKQIYVLVRNLRSCAYRLALASIVLEQQDEDVECF